MCYNVFIFQQFIQTIAMMRAMESIADGKLVYLTLGSKYLEQIPDNTVLYAIWEKNE